MKKKFVILIHGTFSPDPEWTKVDSELSEYLLSEFDPSCEILRFPWEGKNSNFDRQLKAKKFAVFVDALVDDNQDCEIFVIAHSHGGNVALYAYNFIQNAEAILKLVCLGTPYFTFDPKGYRDNLWVVGTAVFILGLPIVFPNLHIGTDNPPTNYEVIKFGIYLVAYMVLYRMVKKLLYEKVMVLTNKSKYPEKISSAVLNVKYSFDEASIGLRFVNWLMKLPVRFYNIFTKGIIGSVLVFWFLHLALGYYHDEINGRLIGILFGVIYMLLIFLIVFLLMIFAPTFFLWPIIFISDVVKYNPWVFGWERPLITLFSDVSAKNAFPPIEAEVNECNLKRKRKCRLFSLNHSQYYTDERVFKRICEFLRE